MTGRLMVARGLRIHSQKQQKGTERTSIARAATNAINLESWGVTIDVGMPKEIVQCDGCGR